MRRALLIAALLIAAAPRGALAQTAAPAGAGPSDEWKVTVYPILAWVPTTIEIDVNLPPVDGGGGGGGGDDGGSGAGGRIIDPRFDGAFLGGMSIFNDTWRIDADVLWAAVGGDRVELPSLTVDVDVIYGHASVGRRVVGKLFVTGGVRRLALDYDITLLGREDFSRKLGVWDPLIGVAWHHTGDTLEFHASFDGGGFGVGSDSDYGATARFDWKPATHFGLTGGYSLLKFNLSHDVASKTLKANQTMHGPIFGLGLYF